MSLLYKETMKLKEKLARENCADNLDQNKNCMLCYLAGFEKAREMAALIEWRASANSEEYHAIKSLGEEEVPETPAPTKTCPSCGRDYPAQDQCCSVCY